MHGFRFSAILLCTVLFPFACAPAPEPMPTESSMPIPPQSWRIEFSQSGGFIGISRSLRVSSDGQLEASDKRSGANVGRALSKAELDTLGKLYAQAIGAEEPMQPSGCADCFIYDLALTDGGRTTQVHLDDTNLPGSAAEPLIDYLRQLRDAALGTP